MNRQLVRVVRSNFTPEVHLESDTVRIRRMPWAILTKETNTDRTEFTKQGDFFLVDDSEVDNVVRVLAEANPGCEVQVFNLAQSAQCPAGPMVTKKVTADGILPV